MKKIIPMMLACLVSVSAAAYEGKVYIDQNRNGKYDKGEKLLKDVMVSDGLNVVKTSSDGSFRISGHDKERFIFITIPSGYKTSGAYYKAVEGNTSSYDFGLLPLEKRIGKDGSHKFIHISDTEISGLDNHKLWVDNMRDYSANENVAFIIHGGDICYENGLKSHIQLMNSDNMDCPVFYSVGNHDLTKGKYGEELFESIYGPVYYSFDVGNIHYIVTPMLGGDYRPGYKKEDIYYWLKNDLAGISKDKSVVLFNHDLLTYGPDFTWEKDETEKINFADYDLKAWLYGHWHTHFMRKQGNVTAICTSPADKGGIDRSPAAFRVLSVDKDNNLKSELRYTYINKSLRIASIGNDASAVTAEGKVPLSVNVYNTVSPVVAVTYNCKSEDKVYINNADLTQNTDWNWNGYMSLPPALDGKRVFVTVIAKFRNGETAVTTESFIYSPAKKDKIRTNQDWATLLQNSAHTGISSDTLSPSLSLSWVRNIKANIFLCSPIIYNNTVYIASVDEELEGKSAVYALDAKNGDILWKYPCRNSVKNTIAYEDNLVFAQDTEGYLYAIDTHTGKLKWEKKLNQNGLPGLVDGLTTLDGIIYAGNGKGLSAYEGKTGKLLWQNKDWPQAEGTTSTISVGNGVVISGAQWRGLYGNDASTGKMIWALSDYGLSDRGATASIHDGLAYIISRESFFIIDIKSGHIVAHKELPFGVQTTSTPLVTDKLIIFGSLTDGLIALDRETLEVKWKAETMPALLYTSPYTRFPVRTIETSPVLAGSTVFFGASDGILYGVDLNTGKTKWRHNLGAPVFSSMSVSGNTLFVSDYAGNVYAFSDEKSF